MWAFLFPGQGSQYVGMGRDLCDAYPEVKRLFEEADEILKQHMEDFFFGEGAALPPGYQPPMGKS